MRLVRDVDVEADSYERSARCREEWAEAGVLTARVEVLEVVEASIPNSLHLYRQGLASIAAAAKGHEVLGGAWLSDEVFGDTFQGLRLVGVRGAVLCSGLEDGELELSIAGEGVSGGFELVLLWEEEGQGAGLVGVPGGDVEVEDRRDRARGCAVEGGSVRLVGLGGVDGDDKVRELVRGNVQLG